MSINGVSEKHWLRVFVHFVVDVVVFHVSFLVGMRLRFAEEWVACYANYWPGVLVGAVVFACAAYVLGLYSLEGATHNLFQRSLFIALSFGIATAVMIGYYYVSFDPRLGRGALLISGSITFASALLHHAFLLHLLKRYRERVALLVTSAADEEELRLLGAFCNRHLDLAGVIHSPDYQPAGPVKILGSVSDLSEIAKRENLERILCTNQGISDPAMCRRFCQLRYSGITVMPLISLFEELCQCVPVELITPEWLMSASGSPHIFYIKKLKRAFDIVASIFGLLFFSPFLLLGEVIVKLTSPGPVFYRQIRSGRFGRPFEVIKLRTMKLDAEAGDPVWATANDSRAVPGGNFLRNYRID